MSDFNITIPGGESKKLKTAGKYCPADIVVTADGGFTPPEDEILTPELVYQTTRPAGWLKMPRPNDYECYCLGHIFPGTTGYFYATITFTGSCIVEFGSFVNGEFVVKESYSPTSGTFFYKTLQYNNYNDELSDGSRQYLVRIYGTSITRIDFTRVGNTVPLSQIVDIVCGIALSRCKVGDYNEERASCNALKYLNFVGNGIPGFINGAIFAGGVSSLLSVGCEAKNTSDWCGYSLAFCELLMAVSPNLFANAKNSMAVAFRNNKISGIKIGDIKPANTNSMFGWTALRTFTAETVDTSLSTNMNDMFNTCRCLRSVTGLNLSSVTSVTSMFAKCDMLTRLIFAGETTPGGWTIDLSHTRMCHDALVAMITSLPTAATAATLTLTNNPGASELTDAEIAVATAKNWTITR